MFVFLKGDRWFYIDDGPLFETLPHLVDYYGALADGLPHQLLRAIQPNGNPPIALQYNTIPLPSPSIPNFNNHINTLVPQVRQLSRLVAGIMACLVRSVAHVVHAVLTGNCAILKI
jgi:hypothetical protein